MKVRCYDRKAEVASVQSLTLAACNNTDHLTRSLNYCLFVPSIYGCYSSHTSRSWWIAQSVPCWEFAVVKILLENSMCSPHITEFKW